MLCGSNATGWMRNRRLQVPVRSCRSVFHQPARIALCCHRMPCDTIRPSRRCRTGCLRMRSDCDRSQLPSRDHPSSCRPPHRWAEPTRRPTSTCDRASRWPAKRTLHTNDWWKYGRKYDQQRCRSRKHDWQRRHGWQYGREHDNVSNRSSLYPRSTN